MGSPGCYGLSGNVITYQQDTNLNTQVSYYNFQIKNFYFFWAVFAVE